MEDITLEDRISALLSGNLTAQFLSLRVEDCLNIFGENYTSVLEKENLAQNVSCLQHAPILTSSALIKGFVLTIVAAFSIIGNVATIYSIYKSKRRRVGHIYNLLHHLSVADLSVTLWCILGDAIWYLTVEWKLGNVECKIFKYAQMFSLYLSTFIMVLIGVDRYIAIKYPMNSMSRGKCRKLIISCWAVSGVLSLPQVFVFKVLSGPFQEPFYQCVTYGSYSSEWQEQLYSVFTVAFTFVIPLTIIATTYLLTVCTLHRNQDVMEHSRTFRSIVDPNRRKLIRRAKMKSLRISFAIVAAFIICWTPYYVSMIYTFISRKDGQEPEDPDNILFKMCFFFGVSNSLCNPIIYGVFHLRKPRRGQSRKGNATNRKTTVLVLNNCQTVSTSHAHAQTIVTSENGYANRHYERKPGSEYIYSNSNNRSGLILLQPNGQKENGIISLEENTVV